MSLQSRSSVRFLSSFTPIVVFLCTVAFSGCFVTEFVGAYFNTYYNAQRLFQEAEDETWAQPETKASGRNYLLTFMITSTAKTKFTSVIEKASKLLQYHPNSDLVDDALLMIGKSYYYQNENEKAERKFKELLASYPKSGFVLETRMLLASANYRMRQFPVALALAKDVEHDALQDGENGIAGRSALVIAQVSLETGDTARARGEFQNAADLGDNGDFRASAYMTAAELEGQAGDYTTARKHYLSALNQTTNYVGEFRARLGAARTYIKMGRVDDGLDELHALRSNMNFKEFYPEIEYNIGIAFRDAGRLRDMMDQFRYVDSTYLRTEWAARSCLQAGDYYEHRFLMYDSAKANYARGRAQVGAGPIADQLTRRADYMGKYFTTLGDIIKLDSMRTRTIFLRDSLAAVKSVPDTSRLAVVDTTKRAVAAQPPPPTAMPLDTIESRLAVAKSELAGLFYTTMNVPDSARFWYTNIIAQHPTSKVYPRTLFIMAEMAGNDSTQGRPVSDSLYHVLIQRYPRSPFAAESKRLLGLPPDSVVADPSEMTYHEGEELMQAGNTDLAIDTMRALVRQYPAAANAPRAQYTIGYLYEQVPGKSDSAVSAYRALLAKYPSSSFAQLVSPRIADYDAQQRIIAAEIQKANARAADSIKALTKKPIGDETGQNPRVRSADSTRAVTQPRTPARDEELPKLKGRVIDSSKAITQPKKPLIDDERPIQKNAGDDSTKGIARPKKVVQDDVIPVPNVNAADSTKRTVPLKKPNDDVIVPVPIQQAPVVPPPSAPNPPGNDKESKKE